ncbi:MAG: 23S rRNA (uracil(1939)-C(5))-methyltransferase RlmD [Mailhella sp.]|nr:23S rRNA (uracil(1939)-C(5))-methyltransferase RlmD [Mailhella sp.]
MEHSKGDILELSLHGFSPDGRTVGRTDDGLTVFVQGGVPGQRVRARITAVKKRLAEAELEEVTARSSEERPAPCPHADVCGGCPWQSLPYPGQLTWKTRIVEDSLRRIGRLDIPEGFVRPVLSAEADGCPAEWQTRNKMEFAFAADKSGKTRLGLRARASRSIVEVEHCMLQTPRTMAVLKALRELCEQFDLHAAPAAEHPRNRQRQSQKQRFSISVRQNDILRFAVIREPRDGGCLVELITLPSPQEARTVRKLGEALISGPWGVTGFVHSTRSAETAVAYGEETVFTLGDCRMTETLSLQGRDVTFQLDHNSFFQVNSRAAELLYNTAAELSRDMFDQSNPRRGAQCWDIYCGVGGLALTMAPHFDSVFGLEAVAPAIELARKNAAALKEDTRFTFEAGDAATLERCFKRMGLPDLLVTDPPRAGMDEKTVQAILKHRPPRLTLVSCNPATLARDLALLVPAYDIRAVQPVDLFPQTPHIETVVSLTKKS